MSSFKKILWITDPHLNFNPDLTELEIACDTGEYEALLCTGDISEAPALVHDLKVLSKVAGKIPLYFVLGNHDYYFGSFRSVKEAIEPPFKKNWLRVSVPVEIAEGIVLTGHDGMYDALLGHKEKSNLLIADFYVIRDWGCPRLTFPNADCLERIRKTAKEWAEEARENLKESLKLRPKKIIFACHVPPFSGASWHRGKISDGTWLPWFSSASTGIMLREVAKENPSVEFSVYCGHTHSPGVYKDIHPNLTVFTGSASYGKILLSEIPLVTSTGV